MADEIQFNGTAWTPDDTEKWLSEEGNALPGDFRWPHRDELPGGQENLQAVLPTYRLHKGYGFWLRTTPYFPGLFEEIHAVLVGLGDRLPEGGIELAQILTDRRRARGQQTSLPI